jgi:hypothetical protein
MESYAYKKQEENQNKCKARRNNLQYLKLYPLCRKEVHFNIIMIKEIHILVEVI